MACQNTENDYVKKKFGESTEIPFQQQLQKADSKLRGGGIIKCGCALGLWWRWNCKIREEKKCSPDAVIKNAEQNSFHLHRSDIESWQLLGEEGFLTC
ncbi:hypothetical protein ACSQ67_003613 [Phaseolus vulgaris]